MIKTLCNSCLSLVRNNEVKSKLWYLTYFEILHPIFKLAMQLGRITFLKSRGNFYHLVYSFFTIEGERLLRNHIQHTA